MLLLKGAVTEVSREMQRQGHTAEATNPADKLGAAIRGLRAVENRRPLCIQRACKELPLLLKVVSQRDLMEATPRTIQAIVDLIVRLAKEEICT